MHRAVYDPVRDRMLVFGGSNRASGLAPNDVWALTLADPPNWVHLTPSGAAPSARNWHSAIYDPVRDRLLIFGGVDGVYLNDVWMLSLAGTLTWTQLFPTGAPPSARIGHVAIYDPVRDRMLVHGGTDGTYFNDVWEMTLNETPEWTLLTPTGIPPSGRITSAIYDPLRDRMVVFGGYTGGAFANDVWELSFGANLEWTQLAPAGSLPVARGYLDAVYDPMRDGMVIFAGHASPILNELWTLNFDPSGTSRFPVTTAVVGRGAVARSPNWPLYPAGGSLTLVGMPKPGDRFVRSLS
jgi:hypothetical protein